MRILDFIRNEFKEAVQRECRELGTNCRISSNILKNVAQFVILKGEVIRDMIKSHENYKIADCMIFVENKHSIICLVELKRKKTDADEVIEKLTNASVLSIEILKMSKIQNYDMIHIAVAKNWRRAEHRIIRSRKIIVQGRKYPVITGKCDDDLYNLILKSGISPF